MINIWIILQYLQQIRIEIEILDCESSFIALLKVFIDYVKEYGE